MNSASINKNPWAARLSHLLDLNEIKQRATIIPAPLEHDSQWSSTDVGRLRKKISELFICSDPLAKVLHTFVAASISYYIEHFASEKEVIKRLYNPSLPHGEGVPTLTPVFCLTGLAGIGKSALINAFFRIIPQPASVTLPGHTGFAMKGAEKIIFNSQSRLTEVLQSLAHPEDTRHRGSKLLSAAISNSVRNGVGLIMADETQFQTSSSTAITLTSSTLEGVSQLRIPLVFACNYSLAHKLMSTNHEMRNRLISHPIVIFPDAADSAEWVNYMEECKKVCGTWLQIAPEDYSRVYFCTYGIRRYVTALICNAFETMIDEKRQSVTIQNLLSEFQSLKFSSFRSDVENLFHFDAQGGIARKRSDKSMRCPFEVDMNRIKTNKKIADERFQGVIAAKVIETAAKQDHRASGERATSPIRSVPSKANKKTPRKKTTPEEFLANSTAYADQQGH